MKLFRTKFRTFRNMSTNWIQYKKWYQYKWHYLKRNPYSKGLDLPFKDKIQAEQIVEALNKF